MPSERKFHRYVFVLEVLSEEPLEEALEQADDDLELITELITEGPCSGNLTLQTHEEVDGPTMAKLLEGQASDPGFFDLTSDGEDTGDA